MAGTWKTVRVFISSTFRDMQAERDHLVRFVFPRLREDLLKHRIHLIDVDLRWGVTSDQDAVDVCREVIDECRPHFIGILGGRYGWVPEGKTESITADEIHYAVLGRAKEKRGQCFFYFRDEDATPSMVEATPGDYREAEGSVNAGKLAELKEAIAEAGLPLFIYPARWSETQERLTGLEAFGDRVYADLIQSLKADPELADRFTAEADAKELDEFAEEADQMDAFIEERTERFVLGSREPLMRDLLDFAATDGSSNVFVLTGEPGSGKSAFLAKFTRELAAIDHSPFTIPHFIGASTGSTDLRRTLRRLCHALAKAADNTETLPLDVKDLITHFQKLLTEAGAKQRIVLVFDALNQFDATDGAHWMNWLPRDLPPSVRIVASVIAPLEGEQEHQTLAILRNRHDARVETLMPLDGSDTLAIIEGYLNRYAKRLSPEQIASLQEKPASNLPLYILTVLEELRTLGAYEEITTRIRTLPGDARALFGWILTERLAKDPGFRDREGHPCGADLVEKFAACLGVSRHGLSPAELTALLDPGDPLGNVAALLRLVRPYLMRRGELLDFYHGQFREAAGAAHLDTPEKQRAAHQAVAICLQAFADPHRDGQCRDATPHALSELPHHQTYAEAWPDLIATLENIFFLEAKVTHGMAFDLVVDFTTAVDALPVEHVERQRLRLLDEALRRDLHFIFRHVQDYPQGLFQCLWNSAWWYDNPAVTPHYEYWRIPQNIRGQKLSGLLELWRLQKENNTPGFLWLRSLRPPVMHLGTAQQAVLRGHKDWVSSVNFSHDGQRIVSGSHDKTLRVWDVASGAELVVLHGHTSIVAGACFSPDGRHIVSGGGGFSKDHALRMWDAASGAALAVLRGHENFVKSVCFSSDGRRIISGSGDKTVRVWDAASGEELAVLRGHRNTVSSVCFSPDGWHIVSGSDDETVRVWDAASGVELAVLREHGEAVTSVCFSPDGRRIVSGSDDKTVRVWDAASGAALAVLRGHESPVASVCFSSDGRRIVSGSGDKTLRLWDPASDAKLALLRDHNENVTSVCFSPDGRRIVSGSGDEKVRVWDAASGEPRAILLGQASSVRRVSFSPDGRCIVSVSDDNAIRVWDVASGVPLAILRGHEEDVTSMCFSPDGRRIVSGSNDNTVRVWDAVGGVPLAILRGHEEDVTSVCFSPDGRRIVSGSDDNTVRVWDAVRGRVKAFFFGRELAILRGHEGGVTSVCFSPDGRLIVSGSHDKTLWMWDAASCRPLAVLSGHEEGVKCVCFSPDEQRIVSVSGGFSEDPRVRVWDVQSVGCMAVIRGIGDPAAIAAGPKAFPFRLITRGLETDLERNLFSAFGETAACYVGKWRIIDLEKFLAPPGEAATSARHLARLPLAFDHITTHISGRLWAGAVNNYLALFQLEGGESS